MSEGILINDQLTKLVKNNHIEAAQTIETTQIQPASLDLRLGPIAYRMRSSCLPQNEPVQNKINKYSMYTLNLDGNGAILESGAVYIIPVLEYLKLPNDVFGISNAKSSAGRLDLLVRLLVDNENQFDVIPHGYNGKLYLEVAPRSFSIRVRKGTKLSQIRLMDKPIIVSYETTLSVDLVGNKKRVNMLIGWKAKKNTRAIDFDKIDHYEIYDFWEPIYRHKIEENMTFSLDEFYILSSIEKVVIKPDSAGEMIPYDIRYGEFRSHFAGFFDPGFGYLQPSRAVLEVRAHEVPFIIEHGQCLGTIKYHRLSKTVNNWYGRYLANGSNYQGQALKLGKQFKC